MFILEIRNSFCTFLDLPADVRTHVVQLLTYKDESVESQVGNLFYSYKRAKYSGDLIEAQKIQNKIKWLKTREWVCLLQGNSFPTGLLNMIVDLLVELKQDPEVRDYRTKPDKDVIYRLKKNFPAPRYFQKEMVDIGVEAGRGVFNACVGSGKSLIYLYLIYELSTTSLIVVPSSGLLEQLAQDAEEYFGSKYVEIIDTKKVRKGNNMKPIRLTTMATLVSLQKSGDLQALVGDINALFLDEFHHYGSDTATGLLVDLDHIFYRFGGTGTFLRNDSKILELWGFLSNVLYEYPAWKAIEEKILTPLEVHVHTLPGKPHRNYQKEYDFNYCSTENSTHQLINKIEDICLCAGNSQVLILINKKDKSGKIIHEFLISKGIDNTFISGDDSKEIIVSSIARFNNKEIQILIGSNVIGEGLNVKATRHMIMCNGGKSEIAITQNVGRCVRLSEGKDLAILHDFRFENTNFLTKHLEARLDIYRNNFSAKIINHD